MPRKTKDTKPKPKVKAKAKASAKVVSNIQNKIIIGDVSKKKRASKKPRGKASVATPYVPLAHFAPSQPFVSYQTRLLEEQPKVNLLAERVNKLELASLYRPALPAPEARGMLEAPEEQPRQLTAKKATEDEVNATVDYYKSLASQKMASEKKLLPEPSTPVSNFLRRPALPTRQGVPLIPEAEYKSDTLDDIFTTPYREYKFNAEGDIEMGQGPSSSWGYPEEPGSRDSYYF